MTSKTAFPNPNARNFQEMTPEAYLETERKAVREVDGKYELLNHTLLFVADVSKHHIEIAGNILTLLKNFIWQNGLKSHVFQSEMRVISASNYFYPDVIFIKNETIYIDTQKDVLTNPTIIFEVLSDETENFDRTDKFDSYKKIASLKEYILVSQYERRVEHFYRNPQGEWIIGKVYKSGELPLKSIPYTLPLKFIYHRMPF
jgi:Uma2 family endonuclease